MMNYIDAFWDDIQSKMRTKKAQDEFSAAVVRYYYTGEEPQFKTEAAEVAFAGIRFSLDKARSGREGGKAKRQAKPQANPEAEPQANQEAEPEKTAKLITVTSTYKENTPKGVSKKSRSASPFKKPTIEEVEEFCRGHGLNVNATKFWHHYESNGWKVGRNPMKSWQSALHRWNQDETPKVGGEFDADLEQYIAALSMPAT